MPLDAAAGGLSLAEQYAADMFVNSSAFRTWLGVATAAQAAARIYFDALPPPQDGSAQHRREEMIAYRPLAIVFTAEANGYRRGRGASESYIESGVIGVQLEQNVSPALANDHQQVMRQFKNHLGAILDDLDTLAYQAGYLAVNSFDVLRIGREAEDLIPQTGDNVFAMLALAWGAE